MTIELNLSTKISAKYEINNLADFLSIHKIVNSLEELFDKLLSGEKII